MFLNKLLSSNPLVPFRISSQITEIVFLRNKFSSRIFPPSSFQAVQLYLGKYHHTCSCNNKHKNALSSHLNRVKFNNFTNPFSIQIVNYSTSKEDENKLSDPNVNPPPVKQTLYQRFKQMFRDYWYVLLPVHCATSICWFGGFYYLAKSGIDIIYFLEYFNVSEKLINPLRDSTAGFFAISYALYKIFTPLRYTVTLGGTTVLVNYLKGIGYIKPMPPKSKIKEMIQEKREGFLEKKDQIFDSVRERSHNLKETKDTIVRSMKEKKDYLKNKKNF